MMYQCGRCGGSRASSQEYGQPPQTCTCPWEFTPPQTPPKREWVGLTDEEIEEVERWVEFKEEGSGRIPMIKLVKCVETKLKEKNT